MSSSVVLAPAAAVAVDVGKTTAALLASDAQRCRLFMRQRTTDHPAGFAGGPQPLAVLFRVCTAAVASSIGTRRSCRSCSRGPRGISSVIDRPAILVGRAATH